MNSSQVSKESCPYDSHTPVMLQLRQKFGEVLHGLPQDSQPATLAVGSGATVLVDHTAAELADRIKNMQRAGVERIQRGVIKWMHHVTMQHIMEKRKYWPRHDAVMDQLRKEFPVRIEMMRRASIERMQRGVIEKMRRARIERMQRRVIDSMLHVKEERINRVCHAAGQEERIKQVNHNPVLAQLIQKLPAAVAAIPERMLHASEEQINQTNHAAGQDWQVKHADYAPVVAQLTQELPAVPERMRHVWTMDV